MQRSVESCYVERVTRFVWNFQSTVSAPPLVRFPGTTLLVCGPSTVLSEAVFIISTYQSLYNKLVLSTCQTLSDHSKGQSNLNSKGFMYLLNKTLISSLTLYIFRSMHLCILEVGIAERILVHRICLYSNIM